VKPALFTATATKTVQAATVNKLLQFCRRLRDFSRQCGDCHLSTCKFQSTIKFAAKASLSPRIFRAGLGEPLGYTFFILTTMVTTKNRSIRERVIALVEKGGLSASTDGELYGVPMSTEREWLRNYQRDRHVGRRKGTGLWRVSSPAQDAALVAKAERNPFFSARDLKAATGFPGQKTRSFRDLRQQVSGNDMLR
jgi:transposase-like protein